MTYIWVILSFVVGILGLKRRVGFLIAFALSLVLSPLIGFIAVKLSRRGN